MKAWNTLLEILYFEILIKIKVIFFTTTFLLFIFKIIPNLLYH